MNYYRNYFQENPKKQKTPGKKLMKYSRKKVNNYDVFLNENGVILTNQTIVSEHFNKKFVTVAQNLADDIEETTNQFQNYSKNHNQNSMYIKEVEAGENKTNINNLDTKKTGKIF